MSEDYCVKNREFIKQLYLKYGDFHVVNKIGEKWRLVSQVLERVPETILLNHREVLPEEMVFDFDVKDEKKLQFYYDKVVNRLKRHNVAFESYTTGGKGIHIHMMFPELSKIPNEDRRLMKKSIIDYFFTTRNGTDESGYAKVDYQLCTRHLVRAEFGLHEKTGKHKTKLATYKPIVKTDNIIPVGAVKLYNKEKELMKTNMERRIWSSTGIKHVAFPCITYFLSQDFAGIKDGRKRALKLLCSYFYTNVGEKGIDTVLEWNDYKLNGYLTHEQVQKEWNGIKQMVDSGKSFGCRSIRYLLKEFGSEEKVCKTCVINKKRYTEL